jgi:subtilisin family serine protease
MDPLQMVQLPPLMQRSRGRASVVIGLIDGPVETSHPDLTQASIVQLAPPSTCQDPAGQACRHGTFVAGILSGRRGASAPAIAPDCTLLLRPLFGENARDPRTLPAARPAELARAIQECLEAGARLINISAALVNSTDRDGRALTAVLDHAARREAVIIAAAGNQEQLGGSAIVAHRAVIPVSGCDRAGRPMAETTLGASIGQRGIAAPGDRIVSLDARGGSIAMAGTSAAAPFVTGTLALLWSEFPRASARLLRVAVMRLAERRRRSVVPPLLDAWGAWQALKG